MTRGESPRSPLSAQLFAVCCPTPWHACARWPASGSCSPSTGTMIRGYKMHVKLILNFGRSLQLCCLTLRRQTVLFFSPCHLLASTLRSVPAWIMLCQCILSSQSSFSFWPYPLSPGLAISVLVCLDFAFIYTYCFM